MWNFMRPSSSSTRSRKRKIPDDVLLISTAAKDMCLRLRESSEDGRCRAHRVPSRSLTTTSPNSIYARPFALQTRLGCSTQDSRSKQRRVCPPADCFSLGDGPTAFPVLVWHAQVSQHPAPRLVRQPSPCLPTSLLPLLLAVRIRLPALSPSFPEASEPVHGRGRGSRSSLQHRHLPARRRQDAHAGSVQG